MWDLLTGKTEVHYIICMCHLNTIQFKEPAQNLHRITEVDIEGNKIIAKKVVQLL